MPSDDAHGSMQSQPVARLTYLNPPRSLKEVLIVVGILLGYLASYEFVDTLGGWRIMYGASAVPALLLLAGMVRALFSLLVDTHHQSTPGTTAPCLSSIMLPSEQSKSD